jgi:four helix bundle protein
MQSERRDLSEQLLKFAARSIKLTVELSRSAVGRYIGNQLMRAAASSGANYEEACGAESKADFIHKMQLDISEFLRNSEMSGFV